MTDFPHGTVHEAAEDLQVVLRSNASALKLLGSLTPLGRNEFICWLTLSLAHLAPSIVRAIVDARLPRGIGLRHLSELPASWAEQERILGM